jgi:hypothetical protein
MAAIQFSSSTQYGQKLERMEQMTQELFNLSREVSGQFAELFAGDNSGASIAALLSDGTTTVSAADALTIRTYIGSMYTDLGAGNWPYIEKDLIGV